MPSGAVHIGGYRATAAVSDYYAALPDFQSVSEPIISALCGRGDGQLVAADQAVM
jgi:hypothetical protein